MSLISEELENTVKALQIEQVKFELLQHAVADTFTELGSVRMVAYQMNKEGTSFSRRLVNTIEQLGVPYSYFKWRPFGNYQLAILSSKMYPFTLVVKCNVSLSEIRKQYAEAAE